MQRLNTVTNVSVHVFDRELKNIEAEEKREDVKEELGLYVLCVFMSATKTQAKGLGGISAPVTVIRPLLIVDRSAHPA